MSFLDGAEQIWSRWEIRFSVLLSLVLQIILIVIGNRRKYGCSMWVGVVIWVAYLSSDSVATFSLGFISNTEKYRFPSADKSIQASEAVMVFWAPFLLVHLGGPDTITAYSLEDNELWLRHLFGFLLQVGLVFYIVLLSWIRSSINNATSPLTFLAMPVFVSGVLKYGEKTWVLWSSTIECFKRTSNSSEKPPAAHFFVIPETELLVAANWFFEILKFFLSKRPVFLQCYKASREFLWDRSPEDAFKVIEIELGFLYDAFFTKASVAYSLRGLILRSISLVSTSAAFLAFFNTVDKHKFLPEDIIITYVLVVGAMCAEIYAIVMLIFSEQTMLRLKKQKKGFGNLLCRSISASPWASMERKMWSGSMGQYNLIGFCISDKPARYGGIQKFFGIYESLEIGRYKTWEEVTPCLKEMIIANIKERFKERCSSIRSATSLLDTVLNSRGVYAIRKRQQDQERPKDQDEAQRFLEWSVNNVELAHSILIWHIATDLAYYKRAYDNPSLKARISKSLSDYMLYLIICRPFMLPTGNWEIECRDMACEAREIIRRSGDEIESRAHACQLLFQNTNRDSGYMAARIEGYKPALFLSTDGYCIAQLLLEFNNSCDVITGEVWGCNDIWDVITGVWIEMLCYVANKCDWKYHIQELSRGGELLTHVALLMVHLGLTNQI